MKLIEGGSLTRHRDRFTRDGRAAAGLLAQVARAVHHAHQRGVLHRDLKPGNILLDAADTPHVTDFGLAKRVEGGAKLTQSGAIVGTPTYMAPEQATGASALTTAADVYGLGAVLYELLTGRPPFVGEAPLDILVKVRTEEPPRPRSLNGQADRDLESVCLQCLDKEPTKRYPSAEALAEDLEHWLAGEPIQARPARLRERLRRWARRHPVVATLATVTAGAVLVILALSLWLNVSIRQERDATRIQRDRAQQSAEMSRKLVDLVSAYTKARESDQDRAKLQLLEALALYEGSIEDDVGDLQQSGPGWNHRSIAQLYRAIGELPKAQAAYQRALDFFARQAAKYPGEPGYRHNVAVSYQSLGVFHQEETGRLDLAKAAFLQAQPLFKRLTTEHPNVQSYQENLALNQFNLGILYEKTGDFRQAEATFLEALDLQNKLRAAHLESSDYKAAAAQTLQSLGMVHYQLGERAKAQKEYEQALALLRDLTGKQPQYRGTMADILNNLGLLLYEDAAHRERAGQALHEALAIRLEQVKAYPLVPRHRQELAAAYNSLGIYYGSVGDEKRSEEAYRSGLEVREKLVADYPENLDYAVGLGGSRGSLGHVMRESERNAEAVDWYTKSIEVLEGARKKSPQSNTARQFLLIAHWGRAVSRGQLGQDAEARQDWDSALKLAPEVFRPALRAGRAVQLARAGDYAQARSAADEITKSAPADVYTLSHLAEAWSLLSALVRKQTNLPEAERDRLAEEHAAQAVGLLKKAGAAGAFQKQIERQQLHKSKDFDPLRSRRDFQEFLQEVEKGTPARP